MNYTSEYFQARQQQEYRSITSATANVSVPAPKKVTPSDGEERV